MLLVTLGLWLGACSSMSDPPSRRAGAGGETATGGAGGEVEPVEPDAGSAVAPDGMPAAVPDALPDTSRPDARVLADLLLADTVPAVAPDTGPAMPEACEVPKVLTYGNSCEKYWTGTKIGCAHDCLVFGTRDAVVVTSPCLTIGSERDPGGWTGKVICLPSSNDCAKYCTTPIN